MKSKALIILSLVAIIFSASPQRTASRDTASLSQRSEAHLVAVYAKQKTRRRLIRKNSIEAFLLSNTLTKETSMRRPSSF